MSDALSTLTQIDLLEEQARDAINAAQYALAETLYAAVRLADAHTDWPTRVRLHYWLADARRMQSKNEAALTTYTWLISLNHDRTASAALAGNTQALQYLSGAFDGFVAVGRFLPAMPTARLYAVLEQGLTFLADVGQEGWAHGFRFQRGRLLAAEGRLAEARQEMEAALALRRRDRSSAGYSLGTHLCELGLILRRLNEDAAAEACLQEVWQSGEHGLHDRQDAAKNLAWLERGRDNLAAAEEWAYEAVALAEQIESANATYAAYDVLVVILLAHGRATELRRAAAAFWQWGRREATVVSRYFVGLRLAKVQLALTRDQLGMSLDPAGPLPDPWPATTPAAQRQALRHLAAAQRWLVRTQAPAQRLDQQAAVETYREDLAALAEAITSLCEQVEAMP